MSADFSNRSVETLLPAVGRIVGFIRSRHHLSQDDAEEFAGFVRLKLVERAEAVLGGFQGRSSLDTYLSVIVQRLFLDYRESRWGPWKPSPAAKRLGPAAVRLEDLMYRQGRSIGEAVRELRQTGTVAMREADLEVLAQSLPVPARRRFVSLDDHGSEHAAPAADPVLDAEDRAAVDRIGIALERALDALAAEDRLIVRLHFFEGLPISSVEAALGYRSKSLYKRVDRILRTLRETLRAAGFDPKEIASLIGRPEFGVGLLGHFIPRGGKRTNDPSMES